MDKSYLAKLMLEWESVQRRADELKAAIIDAVVLEEKTEVVGNVTATYSAGRRSFKYEDAARKHKNFTEEMKGRFVKKKVDWKKICDTLEVEDIPFTKSAPSVSLSIK